MHLPSSSANKSDNLMAASVRGLLDAPERSRRTSSGWRYLQCANTLDELKVLIPPRVAALYTKLLKAEDHELKRNTPDSDKELQYIRYLKDAMVKKCTKLAHKQLKSEPALQLGDRKNLSFTVPAHFTLKRLEQWYEQRRVIRDAPLESTREGQSRRQRADFYVENSDGSAFKRERELAASGTAHTSGRRVAQEESPQDDGAALAGQDSIRSPRLKLQNIASNIKQSLKFGHAATQSPPGNLMNNNRPNGRPQYYANNDALGTTHNPYFDPSYTLASRSPITEHGNVPSSPMYLPTTSPMHSPRYDPTLIPGQTRSDPTDRVSHSQSSAADPSRLKSRFDAAYPNAQTPSGDPSRRPALPRRTSSSSNTGMSPAGGSMGTARSPIRKSYTIGHPIHGATTNGDGMSPPVADPDHRRRATLDSGDTDRSVPRRKGYMYRTTEALVADSTRLYGQPTTHLQGGTYLEPPRNGSRPRQNGDATTHGFSPMAAGQAQLSPLGRASTVSSVSYTGSPKQRSPLSDRLSVPSSSPQIPQGGAIPKPLQQRRASPIPPSSSSLNRETFVTGSPNTQSPHIRTRGSSADSANAPVIPRELFTSSTERRNSADRKNATLHGTHAGGNVMPTLYEQHARNGESTNRPRRSSQSNSGSPPKEHAGHPSRPHNGHTNFQSPAQRSEPLQHETPLNIWKTNGPIKPVSTRSSIYTSGESDGGPVIPDASLIMDAVLMRAREKPHRRQLVPFLSSSEENTSYRPTDVDTDFSSDSSDSEDGARGRQHANGNGAAASYGRIRRDRDGYASGYTSEAGSAAGSVRSRASSRVPSRPPSRGILKRSNSACSQRSGKSVRLEITEDRVALEEAREAEEAVNKAREKLKDAKIKKSIKADGADLDVYKAMEQIKSAESVLEAKVAHYKGILKDQKTKRKALDKEEPVYV